MPSQVGLHATNPGSWWRSPARLPRYGIVLIAFAAGVANLLVMRTPGPVATFLAVVIVSAWLGGTRAGVLSIALSLGALAYFLVNPPSGVVADPTRAIYFVVIASFIVWLITVQRRASDSLRSAHDELQRRNEALQRENLAGKALEELLRRSETQLRLVIDTIPTMAWIILPSGRLEFLNRPWLEYTGMSLEQGLENAIGVVHPDDAFDTWRHDLAAGRPFEYQLRLRRGDGEYRWFLVRTVPLRDEQGAVVKWYGTSTDIEDRVRAEQALRELSRRLVELQEAERKGLARELHDRVGQSLTALKLNIDMLQAAIATGCGKDAGARLADSALLLDAMMDTIENVMSELRPPMLDDHGLAPALEWHARNFAQRTGIAVVVRADDLAERPAPQVEIALFRIAQEALNNVAKHASARHAEIALDDGDGEWVMSVQDDGIGFDTVEYASSRSKPRFGIVTMRERAQAINGHFEVGARPDGGTRLTVRVPW